MNIPTGHNAVMPYLIIKDAAGFIEFTKAVFDAEQGHTSMRGDTDVIQHAQISISGSTIMMGDATDQYPVAPANLFVYVDNADTTYQKALELGAKNIMELSDQPYGRTCGIEDQWGNVWWVTSV